jgi:hypothetical protein
MGPETKSVETNDENLTLASYSGRRQTKSKKWKGER